MVKLVVALDFTADTEEVVCDKIGWDRVAPVVQHGKPLAGKVTLTTVPADEYATFSAVYMELHVIKRELTGDKKDADDQYFLKGKYPERHQLVEKGKRYKFKGSMEVPFTLPAEFIPAVESYESHKVRVYHEAIVKVSTGLLFDCSAAQSFMLRMLSPPPPTAPLPHHERPWLTVADFGGTCKLELAQKVHDIGGSAQGKIKLSGVPPLARIDLTLLVEEDASGTQSIYREATVWDRETGRELDLDGALAEEVIDVALPLTPSEGFSRPLTPSIPKLEVGGTSFEVKHLLRLTLVPVSGSPHAWNTFAVTLVRTELGGEPRGSLSVLPPKTLSGMALYKAVGREIWNEPIHVKLVLLVISLFICVTFGALAGMLIAPATTESALYLLAETLGVDRRVPAWLVTTIGTATGYVEGAPTAVTADINSFESALNDEL